MDDITPRFPNFVEYCLTYHHQSFSVPNSIVYYVSKNPNSSKMYKKLNKVCKYFFIKNPLLLLHCLKFTKDGWKTCSNDDECNKQRCENVILLKNVTASKLWITYQLVIQSSENLSVIPFLISKLYKPSPNRIELYEQNISFKHFKFLFSRTRPCKLDKTIIKSHSGEEISLETIVANIPNLQQFIYEAAKNSKSVSSKTAKELLRIPSIQSLHLLVLLNVPEDFDVDTIFYDIVKKSATLKCFITFSDPISSERKSHLQKIVDEIIDEKNRKYYPPYIGFPGQGRASSLHSLHFSPHVS